MHDYHVVPVDDLRPHELSPTCWCCPSRDDASDEDGTVYVHHALDEREKYETGERKWH
jgi:hypothetical protein